MKISRVFVSVAILFSLVACGLPSPTPVPPTLAPTALPAPTYTPVPTVTNLPAPTATNPPAPTATMVATATRAATNTPAPTVAPKETQVSFASGELTLRGFMWKPQGEGPFPAFLWNHGSEKLPGWLPDLGVAFVNQGYVLLIPHRRGQGLSPGPYISDQLAAIRDANERSRALVRLHETEQLQDQLAGLAYLKTQKFVDTQRIAVGGCSYGGIQTLLGNETKTAGYRAAVDFAGGAQSWAGSPDLRARLTTAVRNANAPVFFIQAENDYDLTPSKTLAGEMQQAGKPSKLKFYPPFGTGNQDGHDFCVKGVNTWGPDVFAFLSDSLK